MSDTQQQTLFEGGQHPGTSARPSTPHRHQAIDTRNAAYQQVMREEQGDVLHPEALAEKLGDRQATVYEALLDQGTHGATNAELAQILGWTVNRVTPRVYELRGCGKDNPLARDPLVEPLRDDGTRVKRAGPSGTKGQVWVAVTALSDDTDASASSQGAPQDKPARVQVRAYLPVPRTPAQTYTARIDL